MSPPPRRDQRDTPDTMLVTGGAGFVGSNFVRVALSKTPSRVAVVDSLVGGCRENLGDVLRDARVSFFENDIGDSSHLRAILRSCSPLWIVNFADVSALEDSADPDSAEKTPAFLQANIVGTFRLLETVRAYFQSLLPEEKLKFRFLQVSTDEVYGSTPAAARFSEQSPFAANSLYGASKVAGEQLVLAHHAQYGLPVIITNSSNNYGPRQPPEKLIPGWVLDLLAGRSIPVYGEGGNSSDWLYVEDHCEGILAALKQGIAGQRYNLGSDAEFEDGEILDRICQILEREVPTAENPALEAKRVTRYAALKTKLKEHRREIRRRAVLSVKARKELGWRPRHPFDAGLAKAVRWTIDQREWYESLRSRHAVECAE